MIFAEIMRILGDPATPLDRTMQVHAIFVYRLNDRCIKPSVSGKFFKECSRIEIKNKWHEFSNELGITKNIVYTKLLNHNTYPHARAIDRFAPNCKSAFYQSGRENNLPFVAGISGHTVSFLSGVMSLGIKDSEELKEYTMACFAFLVAGGNHSFHEVMMAAKRFGLLYSPGEYSDSMPESIKNSDLYKEVKSGYGI